MLYRFDLSMVEDLDVVFDLVGQFNGESLRRVEDKLKIVRTILIACTNAQRGLGKDRFRQLVFCRSHKGRVEQVRPILLECGPKAMP